jgi:putative intracellular protease/amidase
MSSALFVASEEGCWGEECIEPLTTLEAAGVDVTVATPTGDPPVVGERSVDPENVGDDLAAEVREVDESHPELTDPENVTRVDADDYDAVVFPGCHGTEWDINQDSHARTLLADAELDDDTSVTVDGELITARGPGSSAEAARTLLAELDVAAPADE